MQISSYYELGTVDHRLGCDTHKHVNCEFMFVLGEKIKNVVGTDIKMLSAGTICFMNTNSTHDLHYPPANGWHRDVYISTEHMQETCLSLFDKDFFDFLMTENLNITVTPRPTQFSSIVDRLSVAEFYHYNAKISDEEYKTSVYAIIVELLGLFYTQLHFPSNNVLAFAEKINNPEIFSKPIKDIVALTKYSHSHFDKIFKKEMGCTLQHYVNELKMNYAKQLLAQGSFSVNEISEQLGYLTQSHFSQAFKKKYKMSPLTYKKEIIKNKSTDSYINKV